MASANPFAQFSDVEGVTFEPLGTAGLQGIRIENESATARIAIHGAHLLSFQPRSEASPVLWMSRKTWFEPGKPIRGGIPVCWPWFGMHPEDPAKPGHGFARLNLWELAAIRKISEYETEITLEFADSPESSPLWPHPFQLRYTVNIGKKLQFRLEVRNCGTAPFTFTTALHTYFDIGDIRQTTLLGLDGVRYLDSLTQTWHTQSGPITFSAETDRIYADSPATTKILDPVRARAIEIRSHGSRDTVVWNPWIDKSVRMPDFGDHEYVGMLCVETAATRQHPIALAPDETASIGATIACSPL